MKILLGIATATVLLTGSAIADNHTNIGVKAQTRNVNFLIDSKGMALYTFDKDGLNISNCKGGCLEKWPMFMSDDKTKQTAYKKHPLYYFFKDIKAGQTNGDNVKNVWHLVYPSKGFKTSKKVKLSIQTKQQTYLTDSKGMALYTFDKDTAKKSNCYNGCAEKWPVFNADIGMLSKSVDKAHLGTIKRDNGSMQTTYKSKPLYYFFKDTKAKDTNGDWVKGVWHLVEVN